MRYFKLLALTVLFIGVTAFKTLHKYYISVTQVEYVDKKQSVQIITRIFIDDLENVLRERYDADITLGEGNSQLSDMYIEKYLNNKLNIKINDKDYQLIFIGKEIDIDIVKCYLEIENVKSIDNFEVSNKVLFDLFSDQQNIVKLNINSQKRSFVLTSQNTKAVLNFN
ncbi:peptidase E [Hyunsoonleella sp. SJ7]|uniref:Peptidase E n=1 Tax=Hyunsoonleella aquatilis TaxID=2762758 RepID=A0A923H8F8_9FLAO|nr:DUF6702 family protein [Hyunsoonleella aquatilis]MBC3757324.1 peptidase E [Hyunsoonleella aquatilis]